MIPRRGAAGSPRSDATRIGLAPRTACGRTRVRVLARKPPAVSQRAALLPGLRRRPVAHGLPLYVSGLPAVRPCDPGAESGRAVRARVRTRVRARVRARRLAAGSGRRISACGSARRRRCSPAVGRRPGRASRAVPFSRRAPPFARGTRKHIQPARRPHQQRRLPPARSRSGTRRRTQHK